jgi:hypothetical protein
MLLAQIFWPKWETHRWGGKLMEGGKVLRRLVMQSRESGIKNV